MHVEYKSLYGVISSLKLTPKLPCFEYKFSDNNQIHNVLRLILLIEKAVMNSNCFQCDFFFQCDN